MSRPTKVRLAGRSVALAAAMSMLAATSVVAQELPRRWRIELRTGVGMRTNSGTSISANGVETKTRAAGFLGALGLSRSFSEDLAGTVSVGVLSVGTETRARAGGVETQTALVVPFFIGVRRYLAGSTPGSSTRFFGSAEVGPVTGYQSAFSAGAAMVSESITRTALGGRLGAGAELRLGSRTSLGLVGGYAFMTDFRDPIGGQKNHSGADVGLSLGILLGG